MYFFHYASETFSSCSKSINAWNWNKKYVWMRGKFDSAMGKDEKERERRRIILNYKIVRNIMFFTIFFDETRAPYFFHVISSNYYNNMPDIYHIIISFWNVFVGFEKLQQNFLFHIFSFFIAMVNVFRGQGDIASWELIFGFVFSSVNSSTVKRLSMITLIGW